MRNKKLLWIFTDICTFFDLPLTQFSNNVFQKKITIQAIKDVDSVYVFGFFFFLWIVFLNDSIMKAITFIIQ